MSDENRRFAVELYNAAWDLLDSPDRTVAQDDEVLAMAFASRHHWGAADGGDEQLAVGDWFIGHVAAHVGLPELALRFSSRALDRVEAVGAGGWLLASVYEGMARAHACAGATAERARFSELAEAALEAIDDPDEREVIEDQLRSIR